MRLQAYEVVYQTMEKGEHSDSIFHRIVEQNDFLTRDKRFLKRLSYGTIERSVEPVSYTHLDVYKRQDVMVQWGA